MNPCNRRACIRSLAFVFGALFFGLSGASTSARAEAVLGLESFLDQVRKNHRGFESAETAKEAGQLRSRDAELVTAPNVFASAQFLSDQKQNVFFPYKKLINNAYSLGVSQATSFGLAGKLSYNLGYTEYQGIPTITPFHEGRPQLDLTFSLWRNFLGSETRALRDQVEAAALASSYANRFQAKSILSSAETTYWRLALARENVLVQRSALERSRKIATWNERRARLQLTDQSDLFQSQAAVELRRLQLQAAEDEERSASRAFNEARGVASDAVEEKLTIPGAEMIRGLKVPTRDGTRDDVRSAEQNQRAVIAGAKSSLEKDSPTVEVFGSFALNSRKPGPGEATQSAFSVQYPTTAVGVRLSAPLDLGALKDARQGWFREQTAAELATQRKLFEQDQDWEELVRQFEESKRRLSIAESIEQVQGKKLAHERQRLERGRTTTYQVLIFEQDYSQSQLSRLQAEAEVLTVIARMKLYAAQ